MFTYQARPNLAVFFYYHIHFWIISKKSCLSTLKTMNKIIIGHLIRKEKFHPEFLPDLLFFLIFFDQQLKWIHSLWGWFLWFFTITNNLNKILVVYFNHSFIIIEKKQKILIFFIKKSDKLSQIFKFKKSDFLSQVFLSLKKAIRIHQLIS